MKKNFQITLRINEHCNRDCKYCNYHKKNSFFSFDDIKRCFDIIDDKINLPKIIYLHGGEPTLHPEFENIIKYLKKRNYYIELQTNFDYTNNLKYNNYIDKYYISFHYPLKISEIDKRINYLKHLKNINKLNIVDLIYIPEFESKILYLRKKLNSLNIYNEITYNFYEKMIYENNIRKIDKFLNISKEEKYKNDFFAKKISFKNDFCDTSNYFILNGNGDLFRCTAALTQNKKFCNILEYPEGLDIYLNSYSKSKCDFDFCGSEPLYLDSITKN